MSLTFTRSTPRFQKTEEPKEKSKLPGVAKTAYKGVKAYDAKQQGEAKKLYGNKYFTDEHGNRINQYRQSPSKGPGFFRKPEDRYEFSSEYLDYLDRQGLSTEDLTNLSDKEKRMMIRDVNKSGIEGKEEIFRALDPERSTTKFETLYNESDMLTEDMNLLNQAAEESMNLVEPAGVPRYQFEKQNLISPREQIINQPSGLDSLIKPGQPIDTTVSMKRSPAFQNLREGKRADMFQRHKDILSRPSTSPNVGMRVPQDMKFRPEMPVFDPAGGNVPGIDFQNIWRPERFAPKNALGTAATSAAESLLPAATEAAGSTLAQTAATAAPQGIAASMPGISALIPGVGAAMGLLNAVKLLDDLF